MANKTKRYDLKAADRRRSRLIQFGLTAIVILFAVGMVLLIMKPWEPKVTAQPITVAVQDKLIKSPDGKPKVVLQLNEDFLCPACGNFERTLGDTVNELIDTGAVQADYYMLAILDRFGGYSSRAGNAAYCVAEADTSPTKEAFRRFHAKLYAQQPEETDTTFPDNNALIEKARVAGLETNSALKGCINDGKYTKMVQGLAAAQNVASTPTIRINGKDFDLSTKGPDGKPREKTSEEFIKAITDITGPIPTLTPVPPPPSEPAPTGPPPAAPTGPPPAAP